MKKIFISMIVIAVTFMFTAAATAAEYVYPEDEFLKDCKYLHHPVHPKLGIAAKPPLGALITTRDNGDRTRTVTFSGFPPIYNNSVEIYGGEDGIYVCPLDSQMSRRYPAGMWYNTIFEKDGLHHFVFFSEEQQVIIPYYFGPGTAATPNWGHGCSGIFRGDMATMEELKRK